MSIPYILCTINSIRSPIIRLVIYCRNSDSKLCYVFDNGNSTLRLQGNFDSSSPTLLSNFWFAGCSMHVLLRINFKTFNKLKLRMMLEYVDTYCQNIVHITHPTTVHLRLEAKKQVFLFGRLRSFKSSL